MPQRRSQTSRFVRRRAMALLVPLPVLIVLAVVADRVPMDSALRAAIEFPAAAIHAGLSALGVRTVDTAIGVAVGVVYALLAFVASAVLDTRQRLGPAALVIAIAAVIVGFITTMLVAR